MSALQTIFMWGSVIGFFVVMLYNIVKTVRKHCFLVGVILGILKGTLFGAAWFFAWPITMWIFLWYLFIREPYTNPYDDYHEPDDRNLFEQLSDIQKEPVYDLFGDKIGTAKTFGGKIVDVDAPLVSHDDLERDAFGDLRRKF